MHFQADRPLQYQQVEFLRMHHVLVCYQVFVAVQLLVLRVLQFVVVLCQSWKVALLYYQVFWWFFSAASFRFSVTVFDTLSSRSARFRFS